jgi:hypothetical protein
MAEKGRQFRFPKCKSLKVAAVKSVANRFGLMRQRRTRKFQKMMACMGGRPGMAQR